jgi:hypothetical protein
MQILFNWSNFSESIKFSIKMESTAKNLIEESLIKVAMRNRSENQRNTRHENVLYYLNFSLKTCP